MTAKDLKNALLQEAIQGKLVPQIATEGNARKLLEQIRKERGESLPLAPKPSRSTNRSCKQDDSLRFVGLSATPSAGSNAARNARFEPISKDEIPFEIPENWCWCRLGEIGATITGSTPSKDHPEYFGKFIDFLSPGDIQNSIITYGNQGLSEEGYKVARPIPAGTIIQVCIGGSIGKCAIVDHEVTFNQQINSITPMKSDTNYIYAVLSSEYFHKKITQNATGTATPIINKSSWERLPIPLPPLSEQKRIVSAIEKFMPLIEEYGKKEAELKALNANIGALTKKAILQEAIQGRLVQTLNTSFGLPGKDPSCPQADTAKIRGIDLQTGTELLEQIRAEKKKLIKEGKLKKGKPLPEITEDEIPFEIPKNWCWCRLGEIVDFGKCENAEPDEINADDWILDLEDIEKDTGKILAFKLKKEVDSKSTKHIFKKNFVLYSKLRPYLNKCVIAPKDGFCTSEILPLDFGEHIYNKYAQLYLMSPFFVDYTTSLSFGVKMPRLGTEDGKKALFPLPPLAEQKRIVAALEQLLPLCEKLGENENAK